MTYYKVKPEFDNCNKYVFVGHSNLIIKNDGILISNELYTPREREKIANNSKYFDVVEIPKSKVYFFFGARFAAE